MLLSELTDPSAVVSAMKEFDQLGRETFLQKYGYAQAKHYFVIHEGKSYDSKAIAGVAFGYQHPERGPLKTNEFSGGDRTVRQKLESLGFEMRVEGQPDETSFRSVISQVLDLQHSYTHDNSPEMELRGRLIRGTGPDLLRPIVKRMQGLSFSPMVQGKDGMGRKTRVPWIRVYSQSHSPRPTSGWYVVYLFARDGSAVYLSLNQGTTSFQGGEFHERGDEFLLGRVTWARQMLGDVDAQRLRTEMTLQDPGGLGEGYEKGNVYAVRYGVDSLPHDDNLAADLEYMLSLLNRIYIASETTDGETEPLPPVNALNSYDEAESWNQLQRETLWSDEDLHEIIDALIGSSRQIVLAGHPGTGKTRVARALAKHLARGEKSNWRMVQFHPTYSYEEFVEGLRPVVENGSPIFKVQPGVIKQIAEAATNGSFTSVLVIDEMNRANLPRVFGELMFLLEYRETEIDLQYSPSFRLPSNLLFIGTMNTADRSIRSIDVALRRRFEIFDCPPSPDILQRYYEVIGHNEVSNLIDGFRRLNEKLTSHLDKHHTIGHTFFMVKEMSADHLQRVWKRQIGPLIEEYFFDQLDIAEEFTIEQFWPGL